MSKHSEFSPSGLAAKFLCPGSHQLLKTVPRRPSGDAARRGTQCHEWAEKLILSASPEQEKVPATFEEDWQEKCTRDMVSMALGVIDAWDMVGDYTLGLEEKVNLGWLNSHFDTSVDLSGVWGTSDVILFQPDLNRIAVIDYKTGAHPVDPKDNVQLMVYALGALASKRMPAADIRSFKVHIGVAQPRVSDTLLFWETTAYELINWARKNLVPALESMVSPDAPLVPGDKQCKWCDALGVCGAVRRKVTDMLEVMPTDKVCAGGVSLSDLAEIAPFLNVTKKWVGAVGGAILEKLEAGESHPDLKLVRGRSGNRHYVKNDEGRVDRKKVEGFLRSTCGLKKEDFIQENIVSPAKIEKLVAPHLNTTRRKNAWKKLVIKPEGKVAWAMQDDKRKEISTKAPSDLLDDEAVTAELNKVESMDDLI